MTAPSKPFRPYITREQLLAYDPQDPATHTPSLEVNAILEAMHTIGPGSGTKLNRYLRLDTPSLRYILKVATGMTLTEVRHALTEHMVERLKREHPKMKMPEIAKLLGYDHRSSVWWLKNGPRQNQKLRERRRKYRERIEMMERIEEERRRLAIEEYRRKQLEEEQKKTI